MANVYTAHTTSTHVCGGDYIADGTLGPIQQVSANRMLRACAFGYIYVPAADWPDCSTIARPLRDRVAFTLVPVERHLREPSIQARGESGVAYIATHDANGEKNDYQLWNEAAAALHAASDAVTLAYGSGGAPHFTKGRWQVRYLGSSGLDSVWIRCRTLSAGVIGIRRGHAAHFRAQRDDGALYRVRVDWGPLCDGYSTVEAYCHHLDGPEANVPKYVRDWCLGRVN